MYREHNLLGGHVIKLGPGNDDPAKEALAAWPSKSIRDTPSRSLSDRKVRCVCRQRLKTLTLCFPPADRLHVGGGISDTNALEWLAAGAEKVIVTSYLFPSATYSPERLRNLAALVGKERLVVDVSCRKRGDKWVVAMNRWQDLTDMEVNRGESCDP